MKKWYESRLVWLGTLSIVGAGITASMEAGATWQTISIAIIGAAVIVLRIKTDKSINR